MIKRNIEITRDEIADFVKNGRFQIDMQIRDGEEMQNAYRDSFQKYFDLFYSEDEADRTTVEAPTPNGCFYVLKFICEAVGYAVLEDEIGYFFQITCDCPDYYEHVAKIYNYMMEKGYPTWLENGREIADYLKKKYQL